MITSAKGSPWSYTCFKMLEINLCMCNRVGGLLSAAYFIADNGHKQGWRDNY